MTRTGHLERLLENLEIASVNHLRDPRNDGARAQLRAALEGVRAFRRLEIAAADLERATESFELVHAPCDPVPASHDMTRPSPVVLAEQTGRCGYKDAD